MNLIEIDEVGSETAQTVVQFAEDRLAGQSRSVRPRPHPAIDLGCDDNVLAARELFQRAAKNFLGRAVGIYVGRIKEIDPELNGLLDQRPALFLIKRPWMSPAVRDAVRHTANT